MASSINMIPCEAASSKSLAYILQYGEGGAKKNVHGCNVLHEEVKLLLEDFDCSLHHFVLANQ
jgi:hypothetical protein